MLFSFSFRQIERHREELELESCIAGWRCYFVKSWSLRVAFWREFFVCNEVAISVN